MNEFLFKNANDKIKKLINLLQSSIKLTQFEGKVHLTGGCIRDLILGREVSDIDVVVEMENGGILFATYMAMKHKCFVMDTNPVVYTNSNAAKLQIFNDEDLKDIKIECVETRKAQLTKDIVITKSVFGTVQEDAKIRDLTINSLHYNITTEKLQDYNGTAINDMADQILRAPGDPNVNFFKDPIKILRVIRFSTELGWDIEKQTWMAMVQNAKYINNAPQESISSELIKILTSKKPSRGIMKMYYCGILDKVLQDVYDTTTVFESKNPLKTTFEHTLEVLDSVQPYIEHRLAALFHDVGKVITDTDDMTYSPDMFSSEVASEDLKQMKFPSHIIKSVETGIRYHRVFRMYKDGIVPSDKKIRRFMYITGDDIGVTIDLMHANNVHSVVKKSRQVLDILNRVEEIEKEEEMVDIKLPINGNDIMEKFNIKGGPIIGNLLEHIKDAYFENPKITKDECFEIVEKKLKETV